jgi:drug/metabolite transporter (DMT)-like permease
VSFRTILLTATTMVFFAANSLLARLALRDGEIDGGSFTAVRIAAGAAVLSLLVSLRTEGLSSLRHHGSWGAAAALFGYAIAFSLAYLWLEASTGALILFASVQITMTTAGLLRGERPHATEWAGLALALSGLVYLLSPGLTRPSPAGALLMTVSGFAWGCYSLAARTARSPTIATAGNFVRATSMAAVALVAVWATGRAHAGAAGLELAIVSGGVTSGLGYVIWYMALRDLTATRAAIAQLTVPVIAAAAGVLLLQEPMTWRLVLAGAAILGGVALALSGRRPTI